MHARSWHFICYWVYRSWWVVTYTNTTTLKTLSLAWMWRFLEGKIEDNKLQKISPSCNFTHYSSNWLLQEGFLTCFTINLLLFMRLINDQRSFMKNTHSITSGIEKLRRFALSVNTGDGVRALIKWNGFQQDRPSLPHQIGLFFILSCCHCGNTAAQNYH